MPLHTCCRMQRCKYAKQNKFSQGAARFLSGWKARQTAAPTNVSKWEGKEQSAAAQHINRKNKTKTQESSKVYLSDKHHLKEAQKVDQQTPLCKPRTSGPCTARPNTHISPSCTRAHTDITLPNSFICKQDRQAGLLLNLFRMI